MKKVKVYTTLTCHWCVMVKDYLRTNGIEFEEIDVSSSMDKAREMLEVSGQMGVPVIIVDKDVVVGFDKKKLAELLGI